MFPPRGPSHEHQLAQQRPGQRQRPAADDRESHGGEDRPQTSLPEGGLPGWPEHNTDHGVRLLLCKFHLNSYPVTDISPPHSSLSVSLVCPSTGAQTDSEVGGAGTSQETSPPLGALHHQDQEKLQQPPTARGKHWEY